MLPRHCRTFFSLYLRAVLLVVVLLIFPTDTSAESSQSRVIYRESFSQAHRIEISKKLREITGWSDLELDRGGLRLGSRQPVGGSQTARELVTKILLGTNIVVLEDVSGCADVVFSRVVPGRWKNETLSQTTAFVVQIDFSDFEHVIGDAPALLAFNVGWVLLHEFDHIANDSKDATLLTETGECEEHINQMRRECNLPQRAEYYSAFLPLSEDPVFITKLVRLAFDRHHEKSGGKKRYWIIWDAKLVGGLNDEKQIASLR